MPNFNIQAISTSTSTVAQGTIRRFPSIIELPDLAAAHNTATMYARAVNHEDYLGHWDWVGTASMTTDAVAPANAWRVSRQSENPSD
jgi:hypothetical protein